MPKVKKYPDYVCRHCNESGEENFYKSTSKLICKSCWNNRTYGYKKAILHELKIARGGKCERCGYAKCLAALVWHHRDPTKKDPAYSRQMARLKLEEEIEKCDLLCANCHTEVHIERGDYKFEQIIT